MQNKHFKGKVRSKAIVRIAYSGPYTKGYKPHYAKYVGRVMVAQWRYGAWREGVGLGLQKVYKCLKSKAVWSKWSKADMLTDTLICLAAVKVKRTARYLTDHEVSDLNT